MTEMVVGSIVECIKLRELGRFWRHADPHFSTLAYRCARNRLAALRRGEELPSRWYLSPGPCGTPQVAQPPPEDA